MTPEEAEHEINARVAFKLNELKDGIKNRLAYKYGQAFDMSRQSNEAWKAWQEIQFMFEKEINMATPSNEMAQEKKRELKNIAVRKISESLRLRDQIGPRDALHKEGVTANAIEDAQKF